MSFSEIKDWRFQNTFREIQVNIKTAIDGLIKSITNEDLTAAHDNLYRIKREITAKATPVSINKFKDYYDPFVDTAVPFDRNVVE